MRCCVMCVFFCGVFCVCVCECCLFNVIGCGVRVIVWRCMMFYVYVMCLRVCLMCLFGLCVINCVMLCGLCC